MFSSQSNIPPITSTISPTYPSKTPPKYTKDLMTNSWYYTGASQRLTNKASISNGPGISTKLKTLNSPHATSKTETFGDSSPFLSPPVMQHAHYYNNCKMGL